jgi:hypothetical protein
VTRGDGGRSERRGRSAFVAIVVSALGATTPALAGVNQARANSPSPAEQARRKLVTVKLAGDASSVAAVLDVLRERVGGSASETSFEVVPAVDRESIVTPGPPNDEQLARIWIDLTETRGREHAPQPVTLYVVDGPWERVLVRPVTRQANPEVTWEEIGHIVELALGALRAGESIGVGRAVARVQLLPAAEPTPAASSAPMPDRPTPPPTPSNDRIVAVRGGILFSTLSYGHGELASGPGGVLELQAHSHAFGRPLEYGAMLTGEYRFPSSVDRGRAVVRFEGAAFHAMANATLSLTPEHHLGFALGGGTELVSARGGSSNLANIHFVDGNVDAIPAARALARYSWVASSVRLFAGIGADVLLRSPRYLLSRVNEPVVLFEPWTVRPFMMLGIETN